MQYILPALEAKSEDGKMSKLKLSALLIIAALSITAVGSAALSNISFDRNISAGEILVDTDENVAIQITNVSAYTDLVQTEVDGKVSINLNQAINNNTNSGFNTDAQFSVGTLTDGVIKIRNNSDIPVTVSMSNASNNNDAITLKPANSSSSTIGVGAASDFYFVINTHGQDATKILNAVLHIEGN